MNKSLSYFVSPIIVLPSGSAVKSVP